MAKRILIEDLKWARLANTSPPFAARQPRRRGRRAMGLKYERKVHEHLSGLYGEAYLPSPWFQFVEAAVPRMQWCQPDGLLIDFDTGRITIVEVKYQHTIDAWWQLQRYLSIVREVFGSGWSYSLCEVVKWYDCAIQFPEPIQLLAELQRSKAGTLHVHIWKP